MLNEFDQRVLNSYLKTGNKTYTARDLGVSRHVIRRAVIRIERTGHAPWLSAAAVPEHMALQKTTVMYNAAGEVEREWKRLVPNAQAMEDFVEGLCEKVKGRAKVPARKAKKGDSEDLLTEIAIADAHIGMRVDSKESNDTDYDCEIAEKQLIETSEYFIGRMGRPHRMIVSFSGDMQHMDNTRNVTEHSGNSLDVDSRFNRVVDYVVTVCREVVQMAASIAENVDIVVVPGNHSETSEVWLAKVLEAYYHECPNVNVLMQRTNHKNITFGSNLLVWAHGHGVPLKRWGEVIPNEFREIWGRVKHCHVKTGHFHHRRMKKSSAIVENQSGWEEHGGVLAEILPAACPPDAWHSFKGYRGAMQGMAGFEYHREHGLYSRFYQPIIK